MNNKTYTVSEIVQVLRDRMYTMESGRRPREGYNAKFYDLIYFFEHGNDDPNGSFAEICPEQ